MIINNQFPVLLNIDVSETDSTYEIYASISGFTEDNVTVSTRQDSLIIEMKSAHEPGHSYYLGELETETYRRVIPLGFSVVADSVKMQYSNGILHVGVPKPDNTSLLNKHTSYA